MEINVGRQSKTTWLAFQENLVVWKSYVTLTHGTDLNTFQENLVVWKYNWLAYSYNFDILFQENLVVWKSGK